MSTLLPIHVLVLAPALAPVVAGSGLPTADLTSVSSQVVERIDATVRKEMKAPGAVGLSVAVALGDEIVLARGYGLADVEHGVEAHADTTFRIGSITKQFTSAAIMRLAERDELVVDEDMHAYLPDYPETEHVITLRHLMTHTSGIRGYTDLGPVFWNVANRDLDHKSMVALFADLPLQFRPGTAYTYSNSGYYLLGMILEEVSGKSYDELLEDLFFEPLGLDTMRYGSFVDIIPNRAQGYRFVDGAITNDLYMSMNPPGAAGALLASAEDLVKWQLALVGGDVVSSGTYEEMTTPFMFEDLRESNYGLGLDLNDIAGRPAVSHGGGIFGFNSYLLHLPEEELSVAVISNCEGFSSGQVSRAIVQALLTN